MRIYFLAIWDADSTCNDSCSDVCESPHNGDACSENAAETADGCEVATDCSGPDNCVDNVCEEPPCIAGSSPADMS